MWKYYLDDTKIMQSISKRIDFAKSEQAATLLVASMGYTQEEMKQVLFENLIFTEGSMDETYSSEEIHFCEKIGNIFVSLKKDMFNFFLIDVDEEYQYEAQYLGTIVKIINKGFKGGNIIIFQCDNKIMFGSRYVSKFANRDFHFTYWISDTSKLRQFSSYNICRKNPKYSYALYMANVCNMSLFKHRWWSDVKEEAEELSINFISLSKSLSYIVSNLVDSFELLEKAMEATEFIKTDAKMKEYRDEMQEDEDEEELYINSDILFEFLRE